MYLQSKKPFYYITGNYSNIQGFKKTVKKNKKYPKKGLQFVGNRYIVIITNICSNKISNRSCRVVGWTSTLTEKLLC